MGSGAPTGGQVVLVVDDEGAMRVLVSQVLSRAGFDVLEAADGPSAMALFESPARVDLLLTDVGMPGGMNGLQLADAARATRSNLKVLFLTGYSRDAAAMGRNRGHGIEVMTKPFAIAALANRVRRLLSVDDAAF